MVLRSLRAPERNVRLSQISKHSGHTFSWVFDDSSIGLTQWLLKRQGIFWISGKPGSGKSTMMKFIWNHPITTKLLHRWGSRSHQVLANFFFHHRGKVAQRSFEGLLRGVISQILETKPELCVLFEPILEASFPKYVSTWREQKDFYEPSLEIPGEAWTTKALEDSLQTMLHQNIMDLDVFLLFDALDEYDGPPEFISDFLKQLSHNRYPKTRIKILFSSRPWKAFLDEFQTCSGFKIHEHTKDDIRECCVNSIEPDSPGAAAILGLTEDIVQRARGVFLWVKLVLRELSLIASESIKKKHEEDLLKEDLRRALDAFPDQLNQFYHTIIERIPATFRWETYVILECLLRSRHGLTISAAMDLINLSSESSAESRQCIQKNPRTEKKLLGHMNDRIRTISGGLVEIRETHMLRIDQDFIQRPQFIESGKGIKVENGHSISNGLQTSETLQFMHETIREFVQEPQFKHIVLGFRARITAENGHSLLAKYKLCRGELDDSLILHMREAEKTTGFSQYSLLSTSSIKLPWPHLMIAVAAGLRLYLKDALEKDENILVDADDPLLTAIITSLDRGWSDSTKAGDMLMFIVDNGYQVESDRDGLIALMERIWSSRAIFSETSRIGLVGHGRTSYTKENYVALANLALAPCRTVRDGVTGVRVTNLLHITPPGVAERLLHLGADPNALDSHGKTPLDCFACVGQGQSRRDLYWSTKDVHRVCCILVENGAKLSKSSKEDWEQLMEEFRIFRLDTHIFQDYQCPQYLRGL